MVRTWLSIRVELVEGRGEDLWPRPGRIFAAARSHSFAQLADAIDTASARWDRNHLHQFRLEERTVIGMAEPDGFDEDLDDRRTKLSRLELGARFTYEFDFGDGWTHLCTAGCRHAPPALRRPPRTRRAQAKEYAEALEAIF